jgi:hypothetical protein
MPRRLVSLTILIVLYWIVALPAYAINFRQGEWELVVRQSIKGMPQGMGEVEWRECLTQANPIPTDYLQSQSCDVLESHAVYHTLHYKMSCYGEHGTFINEGKVHFSNFRIDGNSKSEIGSVDGEKMVVRYKFRGRRVGDCQ